MTGKAVPSGLLNENSRCGKSPFELIMGASETSQTIEAVVSPFGCPHKLDGKTPLLKIVHT